MSLKTIDEIINICERQGYEFQAAVTVSLVAGAPLITFLETGDKPIIIYSRKISYDGDGVNALLFRDAEFTGGAHIESFSANDLIKLDAQSIFHSGSVTVSDGIESRAPIYIFGNTSNQGQGAALQAIDEPQIIPPNSVYRFVLESRSGTQTVASQLKWVEPEHIEGLSFIGGEWLYVGEELEI